MSEPIDMLRLTVEKFTVRPTADKEYSLQESERYQVLSVTVPVDQTIVLHDVLRAVIYVPEFHPIEEIK